MTDYSEVVQTAREYYNSEDADNFYALVWGGEDIHIGLYTNDQEAIPTASQRTVEHMAAKLEGLGKGSKVLDIGAGYGGAARFLAKKYACQVVALNLSEKENQRDRELNQAQGLSDLIEVLDGSFEAIPLEDNSVDVVWSQDAILHSGQRDKVLQEVARVLKSGGQFIFTDPMQADECPDGVLQPILDRIHLSSLGSPKFYRDTAQSVGMSEVSFEVLTEQLVNHYSRVLQETQSRAEELSQHINPDYLARMQKGLGHWIEGGQQGWLAWGIFIFKKS